MAEVQSSGNGSSGKRNTESTARTCSLLKPSAFASSGSQTVFAPISECGSLGGGLGNNPFASTRLPAGGSPANEGAMSQQQHDAENPTPSRFVLRPSALDKHTSNLFKESNFGTPVKSTGNSFKLEPPKLFSPFAVTTASRKPEVADKETAASVNSAESKTEENKEDDSENCDVIEEPLAGRRPDTPTDTDELESRAEKKSTFVFGENLEDRVTSVPVASAAGQASTAQVSDGFIFGSNLENRVVVPNPDDSEAITEHLKSTDEPADGHPSSSLSLEESAAKCQAKSAESKLQFKPVEAVTGEEEESNVFQFNAKLYVFNKESQTWIERGRGLLRLNDRTEEGASHPFQSRLVMRTQGSLRVILNTMIWSGMHVEKASAKSIQISAVDGDEGVKIFLINANPNDAEQIFSAIMSRVQQLKVTEGSGKQPSTEKEISMASSSPKKRAIEIDNLPESCKKQKLDHDQRREQIGEESNDSSAIYPETEASNEGFVSSPTIRSSSSSDA